MSDYEQQSTVFRHYFVDEAGDPNLYKKGRKPL